MHFLALLSCVLGVVHAAPQGRPHVPYVGETAPGSSSNDRDDKSPIGLTGFYHLITNVTRPQFTAPAGPNFGGKCEGVTLGGYGKVGLTTIEGRCEDDSGQWWQTSLNLNQCLGNNGGQLVFKEKGNFDGTCRPCIIDSAENTDDILLKCNCLDPTGIPKFTSLELGVDVENPLAVKPVNGRFICGSNVGLSSPGFEKDG